MGWNDTDTTGPILDLLYEIDVAPDRILGWCALYWDGQGSINQADIYSSVATPWSTVVDPETLPETNMQGYFLFYRRNSSLFTVMFTGYDEYYLLGKTNPVPRSCSLRWPSLSCWAW